LIEQAEDIRLINESKIRIGKSYYLCKNFLLKKETLKYYKQHMFLKIHLYYYLLFIIYII